MNNTLDMLLADLVGDTEFTVRPIDLHEFEATVHDYAQGKKFCATARTAKAALTSALMQARGLR